MMRNIRVVQLAFVVLASFGASACASAGGGTGGDTEAAATGDQVRILIDNDMIPLSNITVYVEPESGGRRRLGTVSGGQQATFRYSPTSRTLQFTLLAEVVGEDDRRSETFNLVNVTGIEWALSRRNVRLVR